MVNPSEYLPTTCDLDRREKIVDNLILTQFYVVMTLQCKNSVGFISRMTVDIFDRDL